MKPLRLITIISVAILISLPSLAFPKGKPVKPGGGDPMYTADLTGNFEFLEDLTIKRKGKSLSGNDTLEVVHNDNEVVDNDNEEEDPIISITGGIFGEECWDLLTQDGVKAFEVRDGWGISFTRSKGGLDQIHITMNDLIIVDPEEPGTSTNFSQVDFDLHLHGEIAENANFLPEPESVSVSHTLTKYMLWAGGHGDEGWFICNSTGGGMDTWLDLPQSTTLEITRSPITG
jgi:hypothetical protein